MNDLDSSKQYNDLTAGKTAFSLTIKTKKNMVAWLNNACDGAVTMMGIFLKLAASAN
jgi:hypothetical protein